MRADSSASLLEAARRYAGRGWPVISLHSLHEGRCTCAKADCDSPGKHPRTTHGLHDASADAAVIAEWWARWPAANIGIAMGGPARLTALDIDGAAGETALQELVRQHGNVPTTLESRTGKGRHVFFVVPEGVEIHPSVGALGKGIDVRAQGSYIVAPPSLHVSGRRYQWENDFPIASLPGWLSRLLNNPRPPVPIDGDRAEQIPEGRRNNALTSIAGSLRRQGLSESEILETLRGINLRRCAPPLAEAELCRISASVAGYEPAAHSKTDGRRESAATKLVQLAEGMELFHDAMGDAYATVTDKDPRETIRIDSRAFRRRLSFEYYGTERKAPSPQALNSALPTIEAKAVFEGTHGRCT